MTDDRSLKILRSLAQQPPPEVLNFQVNDICNARCVMCNIWQNKRGPELSPDEFATLLRDPFFQSVRHVGITGGEPTLRGDLPRFYTALLTALPNLAGASFITNGFKSAEAISAYREVHQTYTAAGKFFSGMVSLDGVGEVHDRVRGRPDSFAKATATLFGLRTADVAVQAACTIVKSNVWHINELLQWGKKHQVYIRFRIGEFIRRLYNLNSHQEIRAFDSAETKHLVSFFHRLILDYELDETIRLTYESILTILTGGERIVTCPYQTTRALNVDSEGRFATCAPRGTPTPLGPNPAQSTQQIEERLQIRLTDCPHCIHDYHGAPTPREALRRAEAGLTRRQLASVPPLALIPPPVRQRSIQNILIIGWYGTETNGDVAILGGLLEYYRGRGATTFTVCSLFPLYSKVTLPPLAQEMGVTLTVCGYDDATLNHLDRFDAVSMGGGPLMDIEQTELMRNIFRSARAQGIPCHLDGCGIGPLHQPRFQVVVAEILKLATEIRLRDQASAEAAQLLTTGLNPTVIADPSVAYLRQLGIRWQPQKSRLILAWLRSLTPEYPQTTSIEESTGLLVGFLQKILARYPEHQLELGAMHWFPVGWDDREFSQELATCLNNPRVRVDLVPRSPREILTRMAGADLNLCMRFHSVVFAHTIGAPFIALDYTAGGKVAGYLGQNGLLGRELRYPDLAGLTPDNLSTHICASAAL